MTDCPQIQDFLSAFLDGELSAAKSHLVQQHLESCEVCRNAHLTLAATQRALHETFQETLMNSPAVAVPLARSKKNWMSLRVLGPLAAALLVAGLITFFPKSQVQADPGELLARAAQRHRTLRDAELIVTLESEAIELLDRFLDGEPGRNQLDQVRVALKSPNLFVQQSSSDARSWHREQKIEGFNGQHYWTYDPEERRVLLESAAANPVKVKLDPSKHPEDLNFVEFLSWEFVQQLEEVAEAYEIEDRTGPTELRMGLRVLELKSKEDQEDTPLVWSKATVTINPKEDLIERMEIDFKFAGLSLLRLRADLDTVNQGFDASWFDYLEHAPEDVEIVDESAVELTKEDREALRALGYTNNQR